MVLGILQAYHILRPRTGQLVVLGIVLFAYLLLRVPAFTRMYINEFAREINISLVPVQCLRLERISSHHSVVFYPKGEEEAARLVLRTAERFFPIVANEFGLKLKRKVPIVLYQEQRELNRIFGWPADEGTMGVYWGGVVRILSPHSWLNVLDKGTLEENFSKNGPIVHEATHLVIDYETRGNYPRWLTEGLAQEMERRLTGFKFDPPKEHAGFYPFSALSDFDSLPDQRLAYYQSYLMVRYLLEQGGDRKVNRLLAELGRGCSFSSALQRTMGYNISEFERKFFQTAY
ncbi:MAG: hypothetical protein AB1374_01375 [Bacillota bacterium]